MRNSLFAPMILSLTALLILSLALGCLPGLLTTSAWAATNLRITDSSADYRPGSSTEIRDLMDLMRKKALPFHGSKANGFSFHGKDSKSVTIELFNPVLGPVKTHRFKKDGEFTVSLYRKLGSRMTLITSISGEAVNAFLKDNELCRDNPELAQECRNGIIRFSNLQEGAYRVKAEMSNSRFLDWNFKPIFDTSARNFSIDSDSPATVPLKLRMDFSNAGRLFLTGLIFISFMVFITGMTVIVIQKAAFPGMRAVAITGLCVIAMGWATTLPKLPPAYSIPAGLVQLATFLLVWFRKDLSSLPLPFVARSCVESRQQLLYAGATLAASTSPGRRTRAQARDSWGNAVTVWVKRYEGDQHLPAGAQVCLLDYDQESDTFMIQTNEEITGREAV